MEDAQHFVSHCSYFADLRNDCVARMTAKLADEPAPRLRKAVANREMAVFLGDGLFTEVPAHVARALDTVVCDFLKLAWRRRQTLWKPICLPGTEWRLHLRDGLPAR